MDGEVPFLLVTTKGRIDSASLCKRLISSVDLNSEVGAIRFRRAKLGMVAAKAELAGCLWYSLPWGHEREIRAEW